jgi:hypothetical protein
MKTVVDFYLLLLPINFTDFELLVCDYRVSRPQILEKLILIYNKIMQ